MQQVQKVSSRREVTWELSILVLDVLYIVQYFFNLHHDDCAFPPSRLIWPRTGSWRKEGIGQICSTRSVHIHIYIQNRSAWPHVGVRCIIDYDPQTLNPFTSLTLQPLAVTCQPSHSSFSLRCLIKMGLPPSPHCRTYTGCTALVVQHRMYINDMSRDKVATGRYPAKGARHETRQETETEREGR